MDKVTPTAIRAEDKFLNDVRQRLERGEKIPLAHALSLSQTAKTALTNSNELEALGRATGASTDSLRTIASLCDLAAEYEQRKDGRATKPFGELVRIEKALQECALFDSSFVPMPALEISRRASSLHNTKGYKELLASTLPLDAEEAQGAFKARISIEELVAVGINTNKWFPGPHVASLLSDGHVQITNLLRSLASEAPQKEGHPTEKARLLQKDLSSLELYMALSEKEDSRVATSIVADRILTLQSFPAGRALVHDLGSLSEALEKQPTPRGAAAILDPLFDKRQRPHLSPYQDTLDLSRDMSALVEGLHREIQAANRLFTAGWKILELGCDNINRVPLKEGGKRVDAPERQSKREIDIIALTTEGRVAIVEVKKSPYGVLKSAYDTSDQVTPDLPLGDDGQLVALANLSVRTDIVQHIQSIASSANLSPNTTKGPLVIHLIPVNPQDRVISMTQDDAESLHAIATKFRRRFNQNIALSSPEYKLLRITQDGKLREF